MKIEEISTEPEIIQTGSKFLLKVKVRDGLTYAELKTITYTELKNYTYAQVKGD